MNFFKKLWAIYGIIIFFVLWIILIPFYIIAFLLFPKSWTRYIIWFSHQVYTRIFFSLILVRFEIVGLENIDRKQNYIIVSNHLTVLDFMANARAFPGVYKYLAKKELTKVPIFGLIVKKLCVLVDRSSRASRSKSMDVLKNELADGYSVFLYPEGTRNRLEGPLLPFHKGAFVTAIESGCPIAVQTIVKVKHITGLTHGLDLAPGKIKIVWSKPVPVDGMAINEANSLKDKVAAIMISELKTHSKA